MYLTEEDLRKIEDYLKKRGMRDTDFPVSFPLTGEEVISIVQEGKNVKTLLKYLLASFRTSNFINVNDITKTDKSYTLEEAIDLIPKSARVEGCIITFIESNVDEWRLYQYLGKSVNEWYDIEYWRDILKEMPNHFKGVYDNENLLINTVKLPEVGDYAFVGNSLGESLVYKCRTRFNWSPTTEKATNYISVIIEGNVTVGPNGNWFNDGVDTGIPAQGPKGDKPYLRYNDSTGNIEYSFDNSNWDIIINKEEITGAAATITVGTVSTVSPSTPAKVTNSGNSHDAVFNFEIPKGETGATGPKGEVGNGLIIKGYKDNVEALPSGAAVGDAWLVGTDKPYSLHIWDGSKWRDNGEINQAQIIIDNNFGNSDTSAMSQRAVTKNIGLDKFDTFSSSKTYEIGRIVNYNGNLYKFTVEHTGDWNEEDVTDANLKEDIYDKLSELESKNALLANSYINQSNKDFGNLSVAITQDFVISSDNNKAISEEGTSIYKYKIDDLINKKIRIIALFSGVKNVEYYGGFCFSNSNSALDIQIDSIYKVNNGTFIDVEIDATGNNYLFVSKTKNGSVCVVTENNNYFTSYKNIANDLIYNISNYNDSKTYNSIIEAAQDVPLIYRHSGIVVAFNYQEGSAIRTYLFKYVRPIYTDEAWIEEISWRKIIDDNDLNNEIKTLSSKIDETATTIRKEIENELYNTEEEFEEVNGETTENYSLSGNSITSVNGWSYTTFNITGNQIIKISGRVALGVLYQELDDNNNVINYSDSDAEQSEYVTDYQITTNDKAHFIRINGRSSDSRVLKVLKVKKIPKYATKEDLKSNIPFKGKTIWWCGTSIPEGKDTALGSESIGKSYPLIVGEKLYATVYNESLGSSMCRRSTRTGDFANCHQDNLLRALSQTIEEKNYIYDNWSTIKETLYQSSVTKDTLTESDKETMISSSFENRLLPYLDGTKPMPDLFVFDHGHNDVKSYYSTEEGQIDTAIEPSVDNIPDVFAEDINMTNNSYAGLIKYFGSLNNIEPNKLQDFISSVNRNSFIGSMNFLITLILRYNPKAKILIITNYENLTIYKNAVDAQIKIANSWLFPCCEVHNKLCYSQHIIPGTKNYWVESGTSQEGYTGYDLNMQRIWAKDETHPHSGGEESLQRYAELITNYIKLIYT